MRIPISRKILSGDRGSRLVYDGQNVVRSLRLNTEA
jgi:hypothetical protein